MLGTALEEYRLDTPAEDIVGKDWWQEILDFVGVNREQLPELCEPGEIIGSIDPVVGQDLGLNPQTLVVAGTMDQTAAAANVPPGSPGLLFFPYMAGPGTLNITPDLRGVFYGLELHHTRTHFVRAILEGIGFSLRENLQNIEETGTSAKEILSLGSGAYGPAGTGDQSDSGERSSL